MITFTQDSAQQRADSVARATMTAPPPQMAPPQNAGYLQAVFGEAVLVFGGYLWLLYRRNAKLRARQQLIQTKR
jgi:hypothetical protein